MERLLQSVLHIEQHICEWIKRTKPCAQCGHDSQDEAPASMEVLMDAQEVMDYLGISRSTFFRLKKKGLLPHCKIGGRVYFVIRHLGEALAMSIRKGHQ